jgi:hypothetical protein
MNSSNKKKFFFQIHFYHWENNTSVGKVHKYSIKKGNTQNNQSKYNHLTHIYYNAKG